ncbi:MAG: phosphoribosyltransferase family protein [Patescibacteria group bacterium]
MTAAVRLLRSPKGDTRNDGNFITVCASIFSMDYYALNLCGLTRQLPLVAIAPNLKIASFNLLGDGELVEAIAGELTVRLKAISFDYLVGPEVKVVPLLQVLATRLGKPRYVVLRKNIMGYMTGPLTGKTKPTMVLNGPDAQLLKGKKVVIIDDVVSTGATIEVVSELIKSAGAEVAAVYAIIKQGTEPEKISVPFYFLSKLPFFHNSS